ncbi:glycosyltransferase family 4 protein [Bacteroides ihuae]|uniref:glycosyltransferase family 4 protein n=1 Tax=Bacteroides ihuae TaxID=1852362 RepID=UPI0008D9FAC5|nr:glycosyltransferase family 4 protein [Bacteroides ihuae]
MKQLKIAYCLPSLYIAGGMERVLTIKANYFAEQMGYDVTIILTDGANEKPFYELSSKIHIEHLDINYNELWNKTLYRKVFIYLRKQRFYKKRLTDCLMRIRPDITVSMLRREINFITTIKDGSIKIGELHVNKQNYRELSSEKGIGFIKRVLSILWMWQLNQKVRTLDKFVILTVEDQKNWAYLNNTSVIHNPLPFLPSKTSNCNQKKIIAVGRYTHQKGFDMLIEAWRIVTPRHTDWSLYIYGDGDKDEFYTLKEKYSLESLHLEDATEQITDKYTESSIFVLSSRYEGFGMVIIEAMACGVPPISFACPCGPRDIIHDKQDGLLVENGNIEQLAEAICYLIEHDEVRREMGKKARINAELFKIENIGMQWKELFESLIKVAKKN